MQKYDLLVIGAGISGLASAYHVKSENPDMSVCIVDKWGVYGQGNTAKSAAAFRDVFTSETNYKLASSSISFYRDIQKGGHDLGMHFNGYMFLLDDKKLNSLSIQNLLKRVKSRLISRDEVQALGIKTNPEPEASKVMNLSNIDGGFIGENCGIMEPDLLASYYANALEKMGAEFKFSTRVRRLNLSPKSKLDFPGEPFIWQDKFVESADSNKGTLVADQYLLATDVWTSELLDPLGIDSFSRPKKVQVFQVQSKGITEMITRKVSGEEDIFPFTILPSPNIDMRPDPKSKTFWVSYNEAVGNRFSLEETPSAEIDYYSNNLYTVLREYVPAFMESRVSSSWAGYYSMNSLDGTYVIDRSMNLSIINGSSGSGIMKADAAARITSALIAGRAKAKLYGGSEIEVTDLGMSRRKVQQETIII